jgi:signal transduction histidine kinase
MLSDGTLPMTKPAGKRQLPAPNHAQEIVAAVFHDFRGPTRQIKSFLQLLEAHLGDDLDSEAREYVDLIGSAVDSLQTRLEALSRLSLATTADLQAVECDLGEIIETATAQLSGDIGDLDAAFEIEAGALIAADRDLLGALFVELFANALKFCSEPIRIRVSCEDDQNWCLLTVSDSGPGFAAQDHDDAFDLFKKFHLEDYPGTGTGLAIVRRILERHESTPTIESDPTTGTSIRFRLPLAGLH